VVDEIDDGVFADLVCQMLCYHLTDILKLAGHFGFLIEEFGDVVAELGGEDIAYLADFHIEDDVLELGHHFSAGEIADVGPGDMGRDVIGDI